MLACPDEGERLCEEEGANKAAGCDGFGGGSHFFLILFSGNQIFAGDVEGLCESTDFFMHIHILSPMSTILFKIFAVSRKNLK